MGGGGHHHGPPYTIPDYRIYKVENAPELVQLREALAAKGLKDPWIRNEVWRFDPKNFGTHRQRLTTLFSRGFKWGLIAAIATVAIEKAWDKMSPSEHGHGHGHGGHGH